MFPSQTLLKTSVSTCHLGIFSEPSPAFLSHSLPFSLLIFTIAECLWKTPANTEHFMLVISEHSVAEYGFFRNVPSYSK